MREEKSFTLIGFVISVLIVSGCASGLNAPPRPDEAFIVATREMFPITMNYRFSETFENYVVTKPPENQIRISRIVQFPVGRTFREYVVDIIERDESKPEVYVDINLESSDLTYTAVRTAPVGRPSLRFDTMELTLNLLINEEPVILHNRVELSMRELERGDRSTTLRMLMEGIVEDFLSRLEGLNLVSELQQESDSHVPLNCLL